MWNPNKTRKVWCRLRLDQAKDALLFRLVLTQPLRKLLRISQ
jgi:hypothetical protein